jgi:hypothetical protein
MDDKKFVLTLCIIVALFLTIFIIIYAIYDYKMTDNYIKHGYQQRVVLDSHQPIWQKN